MNQVMWVSEWRIEEADKYDKEYGWNFKVTNGGVYTPASTRPEAKRLLDQNISREIRNYILNKLTCPNCGKAFTEHHGSVEYEWCLINLALLENTLTQNGSTKP